ncbi:GTP-binding protein 1-like [Artemia franciscana]|uniref:Tr-type G domain-containing protein n=1 Tax=Artemia franciscana TaxID=6661 RepID=A0AA88LG73_ARTSF|nr:hypothetical protein QYM36_004313 [Artemia franciscana]
MDLQKLSLLFQKSEEKPVSVKHPFLSPSNDEYDKLILNLKDRFDRGNGETIYHIKGGQDGISKLSREEYDTCVATVKSLAAAEDADCVTLREEVAKTGCSGHFLVRHKADELYFVEIRVAVVGNVDAGKSTLLGVLTHGELDNGRGTARLKLFRHKHETESGRTSSVGIDILGFDSKGNVVNKPVQGSLDWTKICGNATKVVKFIDLAGHERYLKTTVFGVTGYAPDYTMLMVGANMGIVGMTKEHLGLTLLLHIPIFVVVTKIDMTPPNILKETLQLLIKMLKSPGCRKAPILIKNHDDVIFSATNFSTERLCPVFQVSSISGENLDLLRSFLNLLSARMPSNVNDPAEFQINDFFSVPGIGTVVSGTTLSGCIKLNDALLLGPDPAGQFVPITLKSIHRNRMPVKEVRGGQTACFALKKVKKSLLRKGMVIVTPSLNPVACWEFEGEVLVLHHPTTIQVHYQAMVHCGSVRQMAKILEMSQDCLRSGDRDTIRFRFIKNPEYLRPGQKIVFREGRTKAVGQVTKTVPYATSSVHQSGKQKSQKHQKHNH